MAKVAYERITARDHEGHVETVDLTDVHTSSDWLSGQEVNLSGDRVGRQRLIHKAAILERRELTMNRLYGRLRVAIADDQHQEGSK